MNELALSRPHTKLDDLFVLTKVRLNSLVVATTAGGYYMAAPASVDLVALGVACLGTALVASGAAALNQVEERDVDRLMTRTQRRPVAHGRMSPAEGRAIAGIFGVAGLVMLWFGSTPAAAILALVTFLSYILVYTPLKRHTSLATVVGAVPGALPPVIGWTASGGVLGTAAPWSLFLIMFFWQLPHFLAIAWMYREDYARAGLPMLPVVDPRGTITSRQALLWAAMLVPVSELPFLLRLAGSAYAIAAVILGLGLLALAFRFALERTNGRARALFYGSITYLPLLWLIMAGARR